MPAAALPRLDRIRRAAAAGRALAPEDGVALAEAIRVAQCDGVSIDAALGLAPGWQRAARIRERDAALRELAATVAGSNRSRARNIDAALRRYASNSYKVDREQGTLPEGERRHLFAVLEATAGEGISESHIRNLLTTG